MEKLPPIEKIYEAYSAIADHRVELQSSSALVRSSSGAKTYTVTWDLDIFTSNDSASYWQGYAGYPVIAVLLLQGRLPLESSVTGLFAGINWTDLNAKHRRNYAAAVHEALSGRPEQEIKAAEDAAQAVYMKLKDLPVVMKRGSLRPPK